jgi:hypothetical protein
MKAALTTRMAVLGAAVALGAGCAKGPRFEVIETGAGVYRVDGQTGELWLLKGPEAAAVSFGGPAASAVPARPAPRELVPLSAEELAKISVDVLETTRDARVLVIIHNGTDATLRDARLRFRATDSGGGVLWEREVRADEPIGAYSARQQVLYVGVASESGIVRDKMLDVGAEVVAASH